MRLKYFACGFLAAILLTSVVSAFAGGGFVRQITANVGGVDFVLNGVKIVPMDSYGKVVQPVAFDGTTYVPIRFFSAAMKMKMARNGDTIYIGNEQKINSIYLAELKPVIKSDSWNNYGMMGGWKSSPNLLDKNYSVISYNSAGTLSVSGREYISVSAILCDGTTETRGIYSLEGKYAKISGYFGVDDISTDNGEGAGRVEIYSDRELIKEMTIKRGQGPGYFDANIPDGEYLRIIVKGSISTGISGGNKIITSQTVSELFDIKLYPKEVAAHP